MKKTRVSLKKQLEKSIEIKRFHYSCLWKKSNTQFISSYDEILWSDDVRNEWRSDEQQRTHCWAESGGEAGSMK